MDQMTQQNLALIGRAAARARTSGVDSRPDSNAQVLGDPAGPQAEFEHGCQG